MVRFGNCARILCLGVVFYLVTLHGYIFHLNFLAKFEFPD